MERTLVLVKPDAIQRGLAMEVLGRLERRGLRIAALRLLQVDEAQAHRLYSVHEGKPFFEGLVSYITSCPIIAAVLEGPHAIEAVRRSVGETAPSAAAPGSIRGDLGLEISRNTVHGSDSPESAQHEIPIFFREEEIISYERAIDRWLVE
jgi:nucleoside-diphosphate kinase